MNHKASEIYSLIEEAEQKLELAVKQMLNMERPSNQWRCWLYDYKRLIKVYFKLSNLRKEIKRHIIS